MSFGIVIGGLSGIYAVTIYLLRRRRGLPNQHPYRDPYGDTPGAWRSATSARDVHDSLQRAPGTR